MQRDLLEKNKKLSRQLNLNQHINLSKSIYHTNRCMEEQKLCFSGSRSALTSNHSPRKGERRSGPTVGLFESYSVIAVTYLSN